MAGISQSPMSAAASRRCKGGEGFIRPTCRDVSQTRPGDCLQSSLSRNHSQNSAFTVHALGSSCATSCRTLDSKVRDAAGNVPTPESGANLSSSRRWSPNRIRFSQPSGEAFGTIVARNQSKGCEKRRAESDSDDEPLCKSSKVSRAPKGKDAECCAAQEAAEQDLNRRVKVTCGKRSKYVGVRKRGPNKWVAEIKDTTHNVRRWLGTFKTEEEAARAFDKAALEIRGYNTRTNFPVLPPPQVIIAPNSLVYTGSGLASVLTSHFPVSSSAVGMGGSGGQLFEASPSESHEAPLFPAGSDSSKSPQVTLSAQPLVFAFPGAATAASPVAVGTGACGQGLVNGSSSGTETTAPPAQAPLVFAFSGAASAASPVGSRARKGSAGSMSSGAAQVPVSGLPQPAPSQLVFAFSGAATAASPAGNARKSELGGELGGEVSNTVLLGAMGPSWSDNTMLSSGTPHTTISRPTTAGGFEDYNIPAGVLEGVPAEVLKSLQPLLGQLGNVWPSTFLSDEESPAPNENMADLGVLAKMYNSDLADALAPDLFSTALEAGMLSNCLSPQVTCNVGPEGVPVGEVSVEALPLPALGSAVENDMGVELDIFDKELEFMRDKLSVEQHQEGEDILALKLAAVENVLMMLKEEQRRREKVKEKRQQVADAAALPEALDPQGSDDGMGVSSGSTVYGEHEELLAQLLFGEEGLPEEQFMSPSDGSPMWMSSSSSESGSPDDSFHGSDGGADLTNCGLVMPEELLPVAAVGDKKGGWSPSGVVMEKGGMNVGLEALDSGLLGLYCGAELSMGPTSKLQPGAGVGITGGAGFTEWAGILAEAGKKDQEDLFSVAALGGVVF